MEIYITSDSEEEEEYDPEDDNEEIEDSQRLNSSVHESPSKLKGD